MKVKLKHKKLEDLPCEKRQEILKAYGGYNLYYLDQDSYTVYSISFWDGNPMYYLCDNPNDLYVTPTPADFFEIIDDRLSKYWKLSVFHNDDGKAHPKLVFPEWGDDLHYQEKMLDGDPKAEAIFAKYKKLMDEEFK